MKWGARFMILLAATFIAWSLYTGKTVKAETPQVAKERFVIEELPDKNPKKKRDLFSDEKLPPRDLFSDEKLPPEVKTKERFKLLPEKVETIVPSVGSSGIHPRFQMITNDMSGETFVLDIRSGAVWSTKPYARKFIQCNFVNTPRFKLLPEKND